MKVPREELLKLAVYGDEEDPRFGVLAVVRWGDHPPALERRDFYREAGEVKPGRLRGLHARDADVVAEHWDAIYAALKGWPFQPVEVTRLPRHVKENT